MNQNTKIYRLSLINYITIMLLLCFILQFKDFNFFTFIVPVLPALLPILLLNLLDKINISRFFLISLGNLFSLIAFLVSVYLIQFNIKFDKNFIGYENISAMIMISGIYFSSQIIPQSIVFYFHLKREIKLS